ncbi:MAG: hypothetical protein H0W40_02655 [Methylibium sp.]|uniref:hypothetical protein n=1 Tax=Methylibium sp. TaxID=2067992 RepID=UPI0017F0DFDE|nr:hypothetical protein [Methylibium sp.]MBA3596262.1 hypothetical protein [Methylibium sp.]
MSSHLSNHFLTRGTVAALVASATLLFGAGTVSAAEASAADGRNERLEHYRAACLLNRPNANPAACVEETLAAREAASQGELQTGDAAYRRNALLRCRALPAAEQPACEARIRGDGTVSGSVEEGGILRELVVRDRTPADEAPPANGNTSLPMRVDPSRDGLSDTVPAEPASPHGPQLPR